MIICVICLQLGMLAIQLSFIKHEVIDALRAIEKTIKEQKDGDTQ